MKIISLNITNGLFKRAFDLDSPSIQIHSKTNGQGKTTLIRFILYSLGFDIPNTKYMKMDECEVSSEIYTESYGIIRLTRNTRIEIILEYQNSQHTYVLPDQQTELHSFLFSSSNHDLIKNILGVLYVDQEKGWTLLNRGKVIGSNHFNIEELIRGIANIDCSELINQEKQLSKNLEKYRQMFNISEYQKNAASSNGEFISDTYDEKLEFEYEQLLIKKKSLEKELHRIDETLSGNRKFRQFIADIKIQIQLKDGSLIPVTEDNIYGLNDSENYLIAKRRMLVHQLSPIIEKIKQIQITRVTNERDNEFWQSISFEQLFDRSIAKVPFNQSAIKQKIIQYEKELTEIRKKIADQTKKDNSTIKNLFTEVKKYSDELGLNPDDTLKESYLFTSNLQELSGALLHKTVFAFRLAYIKEVERVLNIKLPIILDSPSGKEVDSKNIDLMMNILRRDFKSNQIIVASIFSYNLVDSKTIELEGRLFNDFSDFN